MNSSTDVRAVRSVLAKLLSVVFRDTELLGACFGDKEEKVALGARSCDKGVHARRYRRCYGVHEVEREMRSLE